MIWLNPWAWLGILGVALPIAIHLLGRGHARVVRFPTLRFLDPSRLLPTKRSRIQDPLLLAVRAAIVALAAVALAQPLLMTSGRRQALDRGLARAILVDTSASMQRTVAGGGTLIDSARAIGARLAEEAQTSVVVEASNPAGALTGATAWIAKQGRRGEIAIVSDFQRGTVDAVDLAHVPTDVGVMLRRTAVGTSELRQSFIADSHNIESRGLATPMGTDVAWTRAVPDTASRISVDLLAGPSDASELNALRMAASTTAIPLPIDSTRIVAIVFSNYPSRAEVAASLQPARAAWKVTLLSRVRHAELPISAAGDATIDGKQQFALLTDATPLSLDAARLVSIARQATSTAPSPTELEPAVSSDSELRALERAPADAPPQQHRPLDDNGPSDARWLWAVVVMLLVAEWWLRRPKAIADAQREERARAA